MRWITDRYRRLHPDWELHHGRCDGEWSKGAAVADGLARTDADVIVIADSDSFVADLTPAAQAVTDGEPWVVPHRYVYRLGKNSSRKVLDGDEPVARRDGCDRRPYLGPPGGGIVVLTRDAYETVGGIDPRFLGWGGEDVSFGWALRALVGRERRLDDPLFHLWHPHAAPMLRGSPQSETLVAQYEAAMGVPRLMRAVIEGREPDLPVWHERPVRFTTDARRLVVRIADKKARFAGGEFSTQDGDLIDALRVRWDVTEKG
jgi:hypothetical protein